MRERGFIFLPLLLVLLLLTAGACVLLTPPQDPNQPPPPPVVTPTAPAMRGSSVRVLLEHVESVPFDTEKRGPVLTGLGPSGEAVVISLRGGVRELCDGTQGVRRQTPCNTRRDGQPVFLVGFTWWATSDMVAAERGGGCNEEVNFHHRKPSVVAGSGTVLVPGSGPIELEAVVLNGELHLRSQAGSWSWPVGPWLRVQKWFPGLPSDEVRVWRKIEVWDATAEGSRAGLTTRILAQASEVAPVTQPCRLKPGQPVGPSLEQHMAGDQP